MSTDILESYSRDAAMRVAGVARPHGVRIAADEGGVAVELRLSVDWGASVGGVGRAVQDSVVSYLARMADITPLSVDVIVDEVAAPTQGP